MLCKFLLYSNVAQLLYICYIYIYITHIYIYIFFFSYFFHNGLSKDTEYRSLYYIVLSCYLSILYNSLHLLVPISQSFPPSPAVPSGNQRFNSNFKMFMIHLEILLQWSSGSVYMEWGLRFLIFNSSQDPDVAASGTAFEEPGSRFLQGWKCYDFMVGDREGVSLAPFIHSIHIYLLLIVHQDLCQTLALQRWMWPNPIYQITF